MKKFLIIFFSVLLLSSCNSSDHQPNLQKYLEGLKNNKKSAAQNNSFSMKLPPAIAYHEHKLRSPFDVKGTFVRNNKNLSNPLKDFPISMLRFVGTIMHGSVVYAYILSPDNKIYQIKVGDYIGEHDGIVEHIYPNRLEIKEKKDNGSMQATYKIVTMQLKDKNND